MFTKQKLTFRLVKAVEQGEQVIIERNGKAVAELILPQVTGRIHVTSKGIETIPIRPPGSASVLGPPSRSI